MSRSAKVISRIPTGVAFAAKSTLDQKMLYVTRRPPHAWMDPLQEDHGYACVERIIHGRTVSYAISVWFLMISGRYTSLSRAS